jgi:hypothetical protein
MGCCVVRQRPRKAQGTAAVSTGPRRFVVEARSEWTHAMLATDGPIRCRFLSRRSRGTGRLGMRCDPAGCGACAAPPLDRRTVSVAGSWPTRGAAVDLLGRRHHRPWCEDLVRVNGPSSPTAHDPLIAGLWVNDRNGRAAARDLRGPERGRGPAGRGRTARGWARRPVGRISGTSDCVEHSGTRASRVGA